MPQGFALHLCVRPWPACADGVVGSNSERSTVREPLLGGWHMITISTMTSGSTVRPYLALSLSAPCIHGQSPFTLRPST